MTKQGCFYRMCRRILRLRFLRFKCQAEADVKGPVVYICRHRNALGPVSALCLLPLHTRPWAFSLFMDPNSCRDHLKNYTFPVTWKIDPTRSRFYAWLGGTLFAKLVCSTGAIPVYRNSLKVKETYRQSIEAMEAGDSVLLLPDVDYTSKDGEMGSMYEGFLLLDQIWNRKTGKHIQFVPVNISITNRTMTLGRSIAFTGALPYRQEKDIIVRQMGNTINEMAEKYGV